jgi:hypothetical protein
MEVTQGCFGDFFVKFLKKKDVRVGKGFKEPQAESKDRKFCGCSETYPHRALSI